MSGAGPEHELIERTRSVLPAVRAAAERTEQGRRVPPEVVAELTAAGAFRVCLPASLGGEESHPATLVRLVEEVARADGSTGWCVAIGATSSLAAAYLPEHAAHEIYGTDASAVTGGVFAPRGRARITDDGYVASGRWPFSSGVDHCSWLMGGCVVMDGEQPRMLPDGVPETRMVLFPRAEALVHDTWHVSGLRGTGSHDIEVEGLSVPRDYSVSLTHDAPREQGPLYRFPVFGVLAVGIASVSLGIARDAIDELVRLAGGKTPVGARRSLAQRSTVQAEVARAEAELGAARAFLFYAIDEGWSEALAGEISIARRAQLRLACTQATTGAARAVDRMYNAGGGTSIYETSRLQRAFRDVHAATQHVMVSPAIWELIGRLLLGLETDTAML